MILDALNTLPAKDLVERFGLLPFSARLVVSRRPIGAATDLAFLARACPTDHARLAALLAGPRAPAPAGSRVFDALVRGLGWAAPLDPVYACHDRYAIDREARVLATLERFAAAAVGRGTVARFRSLPAEARRRIALAPGIGAQVYEGPATDFVALRDVVDVESWVASGEVPDRGAWSATNDLLLVAGVAPPRRPAGALLRYAVPERGAPWLAPRLDAELILDLLSEAPAPPSASEGQAMVDFFAATLTEIEAIAPTAGELVRRVSRTWVVRRGDGWSAESDQQWQGRAVWLEPTKRHPTDGIADSTVHEAIHSLIYTIEAERSLFVDAPERPRGRARSGWSGRSLHLHAWVHACFVWYALACFWRRALHRSVGPPERALRRLDEATCGFRGREARATWRDVRPVLSPDVVSALDAIWDGPIAADAFGAGT